MVKYKNKYYRSYLKATSCGIEIVTGIAEIIARVFKYLYTNNKFDSTNMANTICAKNS